MGKVAILPGAQVTAPLGGLQLRPVRAVHGEGEAAPGKTCAALIENQAIWTIIVYYLQKLLSIL